MILTHYCVVREDLPRGVLAAQLIHAAGESAPGNLSPGTHAVALGVPDEAALLRIAARLRRLALEHHPIREPDWPWCGQLMAIGIPPTPRPPATSSERALRRVLRRLRLLSSPPGEPNFHNNKQGKTP